MAYQDEWGNFLELTIDKDKVDEDLTDFPVLITLSSGTGITNFDATAVFDELTPSGMEAIKTRFLLHCDGDISNFQRVITTGGEPKVYSNESPGILDCGSMYFDGTDDYISIPDSADWDFGTGDFTLDYWIKTTDTSGYHVIRNDPGSGYTDFGTQCPSSSEVRFLVDDGTDTAYALMLATSGANVTDGEWHHVAVVRYSGDTDIYIDGVSKANSSTVYDVTFSSAIEVGGSSVFSVYTDGFFSKVRLCNYARWTSDFTLNESNLDYTVNDSTKLLLDFQGDRSGSDNIVTFNGGTKIYSSVTPFSGTTISGSYYFDGTDDYLILSNSSDFSFDSSDFTIDFWYRSDGTINSHVYFLGKYLAPSDRSWMFTYYYDTTNFTFSYALKSSPTTYRAFSSANSLSADTWYHIAVVRNGAYLHMFVDGTELSGSPFNIGSEALNTISRDVYVMAYDTTTSKGYMSEIRISKMARWTTSFTSPSNPYDDITKENVKLLINSRDGSYVDTQKEITVNGGGQIKYTTISGISKTAMYFDGTDNYLSIPDSDDWAFGTDDFTIDFWINFNDVDTPEAPFFMIEDDTNNRFAFYRHTNKYIYFLIKDGGGTNKAYYYTYTPILSNVGTWQHIALVRSNQSDVYVFINGVSQSLHDDNPIGSYSVRSFSSDPTIGYGSVSSWYMSTYLSNFRVSRGIARWTSNFTPPSEFEYDSYTKLLLCFYGDESSNTHPIAFVGTPKLSNTGKFENSYYFNGTTDYIDVNEHSSWYFGSGDFTIDFWVNFTNTSGFRYIVCQHTESAYTGSWFLAYTGSSVLRFGIVKAAAYDFYDQTWTPSADTWYHIAIVRNGYDLCHFVDGTLLGSVQTITTDPKYGTDSLSIGSDLSGAAYFNGYISNLRITREAVWTSNFTTPRAPYDTHGVNAKKILITTTVSGVETPLYTEIENWDYLTDEANLWVKVPTVSSGTNTVLRLYYDTTHSGSDSYVGDTGEAPAKEVWNTDFKAVYHMSQDTSVVTDCIIDSTSNTNSATSSGSMTSEDLVDGKIGKAIDFDGVDDALYSTEASPTDFTFSGDFWVSCIAKINAGSTNDLVLKSVTNDDWSLATNGSYCLAIGGDLRPIFYIKGSTGNAGGSGQVIDQGTYYQYDAIKIGNTTTLYVDGVKSGNTSTYVGAVGNNSRFRFALSQTNLTAGNLDGVIDEVRVVDGGSLSPAHIKANYYSNWNNLISFAVGEIITETIFIFSNPIPSHLSTVYGLSQALRLTTTISGPETSYLYDATFYDGNTDVQIGDTASGIDSGSYASTVMDTTSGTNYSWYVISTTNGLSDTSDTYSFTNRFLCEGYVEVAGTRASGIPVRLYRRSNGELVGSTTTAGVSGTFSIPTDYNEYHFGVAFYPTDDFNAVIHDWLIPGE